MCVCVTMDVTFFESQSFFNTPLQVENVCENSFENENNGTSSIKKPSLINFGLPLLDSGTLNLELGLPNPMHTHRLKIGIDHDTRTRKDKSPIQAQIRMQQIHPVQVFLMKYHVL